MEQHVDLALSTRASEAKRLRDELGAWLLQASTPTGQAPPANPTTPLNAERLKTMLHGYDAQIGSDGVVTVFVARRNPIHIQGIHVLPETNIATNISFEPLNASASTVAAAPDYAMQANEINNVTRVMHAQGWDVGLPLQPRNGRITTAVLLTPIQDRQPPPTRQRDPQRPQPNKQLLEPSAHGGPKAVSVRPAQAACYLRASGETSRSTRSANRSISAAPTSAPRSRS